MTFEKNLAQGLEYIMFLDNMFRKKKNIEQGQ